MLRVLSLFLSLDYFDHAGDISTVKVEIGIKFTL